jgi:hypothetical protein
MPVPSAWIIVPISFDESMRSKRARSTFRILPLQRQDRLEIAVAALLGRSACRVTLDEEQFGLGGIALLAVGELAGQRGDVHRALAPGQLARLLRGFARRGGVDDLLDDRLA